MNSLLSKENKNVYNIQDHVFICFIWENLRKKRLVKGWNFKWIQMKCDIF
jgi:hypothetical protein